MSEHAILLLSCGDAYRYLQQDGHLAAWHHDTASCPALRPVLPAESWPLAAVRGHKARHSTLCPAATVKRRMQTVPAMVSDKEAGSLLLPAWLRTCRSCSMANGGWGCSALQQAHGPAESPD